MKALVVLLAASGLLLASQCPAQAQVSWGIPLPFPFLFYNFNQGYQQPQPYYGNQRAYYSQPYYGGQRVYYRPGYSRPGDCTPSRHAYFYRPYYQPRYYTDHNRAIITGRNLATTGLAGADTEVGKGSVDGRRHPIALNSWVSNSAFTEHSGVITTQSSLPKCSTQNSSTLRFRSHLQRHLAAKA